MFICTVSHEHITFELIREGSAHLVLVPIGYDDAEERDVSYSAAVGMDILAGGSSELFFNIIEFDHDTGEEYRFWSGRDTSSFILGSDRDRVLEAVCFAAQILIDNGAPDQFDVTTFDESPPDHAVIKHFKVMSVFERNGYAITTLEPYLMKRHWQLVRSKG